VTSNPYRCFASRFRCAAPGALTAIAIVIGGLAACSGGSPNAFPSATPGVCDGAAAWSSASPGFEKLRGPVVSATYAAASRGQPTFLNVGLDYPNPSRVTIVIWGENRASFAQAPETTYAGRTICFEGEVTLYQGVRQVTVTSPTEVIIDGSAVSTIDSSTTPTSEVTTPPVTSAAVTTVIATPTSETRIPPTGLQALGLVGSWYHHGFTLTIGADGSASAHWRVYRWCSTDPTPPCDQMVTTASGNQIIDGGQATMTVAVVPQSSVAIATMIGSTDETTLRAHGTVRLAPILGRTGPGHELIFPILRDPSFRVCDEAALQTGDCGA
jgi:hypothetical protein